MFSVETTLKLIEDFQARSCLWDVASLIIKIEIKGEMPCANLQSDTGYQIRRWKKNHNLKTQFRREHKKLKQSKKSGVSPSKCNWFGYQPLLFLLQGTESRGSRSTDCEDAEAENEVSYQFVFKILYFRDLCIKMLRMHKFIFVQTT